MKCIHLIFDSTERRAESFCKFLKKNFSESNTQEVIVEMFNRTPRCDITGSAFRNKSVYVRIPLKIPTESVKDTDDTGSKVFCFIHFGEHAKNNIADRVKKTVKKAAVVEEINTEFFRNGKNTVSVNAGNKFAGHVEGTELIVFVAAGRTETALATEGNELHGTATGTAIHGTTVRRVTTMNHLANIFNDSRTRMKFVNYMFIIISKNRL